MPRYRFRVRTPDGQEILSDVFDVGAVPPVNAVRPLNEDGNQEKAPHHFELVLEDDQGKPRAGVKFTVHAGGDVIEGATGPDGKLQAKIPKQHTEGVLALHGEHGDELHHFAVG